jgi:hypothetical protein
MDIHDLDFRSKIENHIAGLQNHQVVSIPLWDDQVSHRIVSIIKKIFAA